MAGAWVAACALALTLSGCGGARRESVSLTVAAVHQPATSLFYVAQDARCFAGEGLRVEERSFDLGRDALAQLRDGAADVAIAYETPLLRAALADPRLRVLTKLHTSTRNTRLVSRAAAGIRGFEDLRGRRVSLARGTNAEFFAELGVGLGGVPREAVEVRDLAPAASVEALARGEVDAAVLSDPYAGDAEQLLGAGGATLLGDLYVEASLLVTRDDVVTTRGPALRALVRGLACAERRARERPAEARALVRARFPGQAEATLAAQLGRVTWGLGLDNVLLDVLRREREWLVGSDPRAPASDLRQLVDVRVLDDVAPDSVTLLPVPAALRW